MTTRTRFAGTLCLTIAVLFACSSTHAADAKTPSPAEQSVRALERAWLDAYEQLDTVAMARIVADDFLITFPDGSTQTKAQILRAQRSQRSRPGPYTTRFHTENTTSRAYGKTVVLTGIVVTVWQRDGKPVEDRSTYTDTYVERDGKWQVVASHLSNVPKPPAPAPATDTSRAKP
jgi:uncharacterized protein (TIGR02246 family)